MGFQHGRYTRMLFVGPPSFSKLNFSTRDSTDSLSLMKHGSRIAMLMRLLFIGDHGNSLGSTMTLIDARNSLSLLADVPWNGHAYA
jgi:hypothetical protein